MLNADNCVYEGDFDTTEDCTHRRDKIQVQETSFQAASNHITLDTNINRSTGNDFLSLQHYYFQCACHYFWYDFVIGHSLSVDTDTDKHMALDHLSQ